MSLNDHVRTLMVSILAFQPQDGQHMPIRVELEVMVTSVQFGAKEDIKPQ